MSKTKRFFAILMTMALAMSMLIASSAMSFAANDIEGAAYDTAYFTVGADEVDLDGHTFNAVQIVKATTAVKDDKGEYTGEYTGLSWGAQMSDAKVTGLLAALKADNTLKDDFKDFTDDFTAAAFADTISDYEGAKAEALIKVIKGLQLPAGQTITVAKDMQPVELTAGIGLYMIDDTTASLDNDVANATILTAVPGSNTIRIKVDKPSQDKEVKENSSKMSGDGWNEVSDYNIGDYVPYKITSKVPNAEKFDNYTMTFTDEMSSGLTFADTISGVAADKKLKVTVGTQVLDPANYTLNSTDAQHFTVTLQVKNNGTQTLTAGSDIKIEFYGLLNANAVIGLDGNTNKSKLTYSNNPDDDSSTTETPWDTVITFTYELDVTKIDGETSAKLPGAQFALKATTGEHADDYVVVNDAGKVTGWTSDKPAADATDNGALLVANDQGQFNVIGLDDGTYVLEEIKAPKGYTLIEPITLVISATTSNGSDYTDVLHDHANEALTGTTLKVDDEDAVASETVGVLKTTVENRSGATLPETGGIGTIIFYVLGTLLVVGCGIVLISKKRMESK